MPIEKHRFNARFRFENKTQNWVPERQIQIDIAVATGKFHIFPVNYRWCELWLYFIYCRSEVNMLPKINQIILRAGLAFESRRFMEVCLGFKPPRLLMWRTLWRIIYSYAVNGIRNNRRSILFFKIFYTNELCRIR